MPRVRGGLHIHVASRLKAIVIIFSNFLLAVFAVKSTFFTQVTNWKPVWAW